jgi:hypothetical protein
MVTHALDEIKAIVANPQESFGIELKGWVDPQSNKGRAVIAKGCMASRNNNGGLLLLGFNNDGSVSQENVPADVRAIYHVDAVQEIVSKYASEPFGISVEYVDRGSLQYPVIIVPCVVRTPVA